MRSLTLGEVIDLHQRVIEETGGAVGVRDLSALKAAVSLPRVTFDGRDLYPSIVEKAAALCFSLVMNHPFLDGNKRSPRRPRGDAGAEWPRVVGNDR